MRLKHSLDLARASKEGVVHTCLFDGDGFITDCGISRSHENSWALKLGVGNPKEVTCKRCRKRLFRKN